MSFKPIYNVRDARNQRRSALVEQTVWPDTRRAGDGARDGADHTAELMCVVCDLH